MSITTLFLALFITASPVQQKQQTQQKKDFQRKWMIVQLKGFLQTTTYQSKSINRFKYN